MNPDYDLIQPIHAAFAPYASRLTFITIPGAPWSKSRPKFGTKRGYQDPADRAMELRTRGIFRRHVSSPFTGNVAITCAFFRPNRQRIDTDNLIKHVCDSGNKVLWNDDSQITSVYGRIELDRDDPRTVVIISDHESSMTRGTDYVTPCANCGADICLDGRDRAPKYCSPECSKARHGGVDLSTPIPCVTCLLPFVRKTSSQKYCSPGCIKRLGRPKSPTRNESFCIDCGSLLSKPGYQRCRACWTAARASAIS